jgi:hypothetical protein
MILIARGIIWYGLYLFSDIAAPLWCFGSQPGKGIRSRNRRTVGDFRAWQC